MTITAIMAGAIAMLAQFGSSSAAASRDNPLGIIGVLVVMMLAPLAAVLVQMAISRTREYEADRVGAEITGQPLWLASALAKIERAQPIDNYPAEANPATAHMFIINPLHGWRRQPVPHPSVHRGTHRAGCRKWRRSRAPTRQPLDGQLRLAAKPRPVELDALPADGVFLELS